MLKILICPTCDGHGTTIRDTTNYTINFADRISQYVMLKCPRCEGSGRLIEEIIYRAYREESCTK